jgi:hypothetical protein
MADARPGFRVIDTGLRTGRANIAFDQAMIEARSGSFASVPQHWSGGTRSSHTRSIPITAVRTV